MTIKAIETRYQGYRFRSRLEARWAVFFDALETRWEYEPEGYELPSGRYLPDFYLPDLRGGVFLEVKPVDFLSYERDVLKRALGFIFELTRATGKICMIVNGAPEHRAFEGTDPHSKIELMASYSFLYGPKSGADLVVGTYEKVLDHFAPTSAIEAARSARFEFGETPHDPNGGYVF